MDVANTVNSGSKREDSIMVMGFRSRERILYIMAIMYMVEGPLEPRTECTRVSSDVSKYAYTAIHHKINVFSDDRKRSEWLKIYITKDKSQYQFSSKDSFFGLKIG